MIITIFVVDSLLSYDSSRQNACRGHMQSNNDISGIVFLPPYLMPEQTGIRAGSEIVVIFDQKSGFGVAQIGMGDAEFNGKMNYNIKTTGSIEADNDVKTGRISLKEHIHSATLNVEGVTVDGVGVSGAATGNTGAATGIGV